MRDYSQYSITPTKKKNRNLTPVTPSPASSVASFPSYRNSINATKSQVAVLNRTRDQLQQHQPHHTHPPVAPPPPQQKRDAGSISTAATQSSNDHSPRSHSEEDPQQQQQHNQRYAPSPLHHPQQQHSSYAPKPSSQSPKQHQYHASQQQQAPSSPPPPGSPRDVSIPITTSSNTSPPNSNHRDLSMLTPTDALSLKRDGPASTILQLRQALEEARVRDAAEKTTLAKSDATILELRSSVRQLKRQLEKLDGDARQKHQELVVAKQQLLALKQKQQEDSSESQQQQQQHAMAKEERVGELQVQLDRAHAQILTADMVRKELEDTLEAEQYTWELRVQDQERTIVELQQEMGVLAQDLDVCRLQWKQADEEWAQKVAELERTLPNTTVQQSSTSPQRGDNLEVQSLREKLKQLEDERNELQTCLDEALLELEAVDAELGSHTPAEVQQLRQENQRLQEAVTKQRQLQQQQQLQQGDADFDTLEGLQHLYRWLLERSEGEEKKSDTLPQTSPELLDCIHHILEEMDDVQKSSNSAKDELNRAKEANTQRKVTELEKQLSAYRGDLQAREESSTELRSSLKEAVALIKPLQDAVDKADQQKADLQQEIERLRSDHETETKEMQDERQELERTLKAREQECEQLQHDLHRLQVELEDAKELTKARQTLHGLSPTAAAAAAVASKTRPPTEQPQELSSLSKARADLKAKRAQEQTLRSLLRDAQNRFHSLNQQNHDVEALNQQLQGRLRDVEEHHSVQNKSSIDEGFEVEVGPTANNVTDLEKQVTTLKQALKERTGDLESLKEQANKPNPEYVKRLQELESKLAKTEVEFKQKVHSEKVLNKSLKEALGLLKPLKSHLEEAEAENKDLSKEVRTLRRKVTSMEISGMGTVVASPNSMGPKSPHGGETPIMSNSNNEKVMREKAQLEDTVRHLEQENSQLHDALDELSRMNNGHMAGTDRLSPNIHGNPNTPNSAVSSKAEAQLNQEIVELKSRYEVTQSRLEDAYVENHTLVEALKEKEESEKDAVEGMRILREKLRKTEMDLENAKYIATSALVNVEHAKSMEHNISINSAFETESHTVLSLEEKAIELDLMASAGVRPSPSPRNGTSPYLSQQRHPQQQQQRQQQMQFSGGHQQQQHMQMNGSHSVNGWAGKRSRLADF